MNEKLEAAYEELREIIDGGSESFTHADAVQYLKDVLAKQEQGEPVAFKIYLPKAPRQDVNHGLLPWVYDQDPSSGNVASMWVTPVKTTPQQRKPLTDKMVFVAARVMNDRQADACNVDRDDQWKIYGQDFIDDARAMLEAAHGIKE